MSDALSRAQAEIRAVLAASPNLEDARHAEDTLAWLLRLQPRISPALALAALGHDIDKACAQTGLLRAESEDYDAYQNAHAADAAVELRSLLGRCGVGEDVIVRAGWLVEHHECGGDREAGLLRDADKLSWMRVKLAACVEHEGAAEAERRCRWAYARLSASARRYLAAIHPDDPRLRRLLHTALLPKTA